MAKEGCFNEAAGNTRGKLSQEFREKHSAKRFNEAAGNTRGKLGF